MKPGCGEIRGDTHYLAIRVYYEDTDMAAIVYYANYLRYFERGRTDYLRCMGVSQQALRNSDAPRTFAVHRAEIDYLKPAVLDDELVVTTRVKTLRKASMIMVQEIFRGEACLTRAAFTIACLNAAGRPVRLPAIWR